MIVSRSNAAFTAQRYINYSEERLQSFQRPHQITLETSYSLRSLVTSTVIGSELVKLSTISKLHHVIQWETKPSAGMALIVGSTFCPVVNVDVFPRFFYA